MRAHFLFSSPTSRVSEGWLCLSELNKQGSIGAGLASASIFISKALSGCSVTPSDSQSQMFLGHVMQERKIAMAVRVTGPAVIPISESPLESRGMFGVTVQTARSQVT